VKLGVCYSQSRKYVGNPQTLDLTEMSFTEFVTKLLFEVKLVAYYFKNWKFFENTSNFQQG
jgi:hypothetical protein